MYDYTIVFVRLELNCPSTFAFFGGLSGRASYPVATHLYHTRRMSSPNNQQRPDPSIRRTARWISNFANRDFCPWANRYVYWLKQPVGWLLVAAAASLLIGLFVAPQGWVMFTALLAVILLGVVWPWIAIRGVSCSLCFNRRRATEGDDVQVTLSVKNSFPWPIWGLAVEGGFFLEDISNSNDSTAVALARVPGWTKSDFKWEFEPHRRGLYPSGVCQITNAFPFGIWKTRKIIQITSELIVWPLTVKLKSIPPVKGSDFTATGILMNQAGMEGDVLAVRPYRRGDTLKHVHWAQTARHSRLIVCERQTAAQRKVEIVIDTDLRVHQTLSDHGSLEWAIRVGASLVREFHEHGWSVIHSTDLNGGYSSQGAFCIQSAFDRLAMLQPGTVEGFKDLYSEDSRPNKMKIVVTTSDRMDELKQLESLESNLRFVVLQTGERHAGENAWLTIDCTHDVPSQLQTQWERLCHESWSAA